jgi:hypothetical protein
MQITKIHDYDMEINPTYLIHGQGLAKLMVERNVGMVEDL